MANALDFEFDPEAVKQAIADQYEPAYAPGAGVEFLLNRQLAVSLAESLGFHVPVEATYALMSEMGYRLHKVDNQFFWMLWPRT